MTKVCSSCRQSKPLSAFGNDHTSKDGKSWYCLECSRRKANRRRMEITYRAVFERDNYKCALCSSTLDLEIHHKKEKSNEQLDNLILVCHKCHIQKLHHGVWNRKLPEVTCRRCGHSWYPRQPEVRICPKCKSPYWDKARVK